MFRYAIRQSMESLRAHKSSKARKQRRASLSLEQLEDRWAPAAGGLDPSFGSGGKVVTPIGTGNDNDVANSVVIDASGRILVAGSVFSDTRGNSDFALARFNADGTLDAAFGPGGKVTTAIGVSDEFGNDVAIDGFGRIVVAGYANIGGNVDFALVRYNTDGTLDTSFGTAGKVTTPIGAGVDHATSVAIDGSGRIVVAGHASIGGNTKFALARYEMNGALDTSFDGDGKTTADFAGIGKSVAIDGIGRILVAGHSSGDFALARFNTNGSLDTSFGDGGKVTTSFGTGEDVGNSVAIDELGRIVVAGHRNASDVDIALVRYNVDGTVDRTFGFSGIVTAIGVGTDLGKSVAIDQAGNILVAGSADIGAVDQFVLVRYRSNGSLDASFGDEGKVATLFGTNSNVGNSVAIGGSGRIVVAGYTGNGSNGVDFALARYFGRSFTVAPGTSLQTFVEDDGARIIDSSAALTDSPNADVIGATVRIGNFVRNQDILNYTLQGGISGSFDPIVGVLTFSNPAPIADYEAVLRSLTYTNTSQQPDERTRTITVTVDDGEEFASATYTIHILSRNDVPSFSDAAVLPAILQGTDEPSGRKVSSLFAGLLVDPDGDSLGGVAVIGNATDPVTQGTWQYSTDVGVSWLDVGTVGEGAAALAVSAATRLRFKAVASFSGKPVPLVVRAIDSTFTGAYTAGAVRQFVDTSSNGGTTPIAVTTNAVITTVFPVNPVPNTPPTLLGVPFSAKQTRHRRWKVCHSQSTWTKARPCRSPHRPPTPMWARR